LLRVLLGFLGLGLTLGLREQVPLWGSFAGLAAALALYGIPVLILVRSHRDQAARWIGGSFDVLLALLAIVFLATGSDSIGGAPVFMSAALLAGMTLSVLQFGIFLGAGVSVGAAAWLLLTSYTIGEPLEGTETIFIQLPLLVVFGGLVASLWQNLGRFEPPVLSSPMPLAVATRALTEGQTEVEGKGHESLHGPERLRLYITEEQAILRRAYEVSLWLDPAIDLVGVQGQGTADELSSAVRTTSPDVVVVGLNVLEPGTVEELREFRAVCPVVPLIILSHHYTVGGVKALRKFSSESPAPYAYLLKQTVGSVEQLTEIARAVAHGRMVLDPSILEALVEDPSSGLGLLRELTSVEWDVLKWMARGYQDSTIARLLHTDQPALERHAQSIYKKLTGDAEGEDARVRAVTVYLKATGLLRGGGGE
jgi:DNA-binding NarL/FixJ family response regulator